MKSGFVTIIGRPNVGKSTLLNKVLGQKIVITTNKAQTTRKRIKGILTDSRGQIVFVDTPGVHKPLNKLGEFLLDEAKISVPDSDLILFVTDSSTQAGKGDKWIVQNMLEKTNTPIILVLNKSDIASKNEISDNIISYKNLLTNETPFVCISAKNGKGIEDLINTIYKNLPDGDLLYPEDTLTEETMRDIASEVVREKILINTQDEIPHSIAVMIDNYKEEENIDKIYATIYCEHKSQKGILIGKGGNLLKKIGTQAREELENIVEKKVYLDLTVKIEKDWRKKDNILKKLGYFEEKN